MTSPHLFSSSNRRWLWIFVVLLPIVIYAVIKERQSWRPREVKVSQEHLYALTWSPDGKFIAVSTGFNIHCFDSTLLVPKPGYKSTSLQSGWGSALQNLSYSPDSSLLAAGTSWDGYTVLNAHSGKILWREEEDNGAIGFAERGKQLQSVYYGITTNKHTDNLATRNSRSGKLVKFTPFVVPKDVGLAVISGCCVPGSPTDWRFSSDGKWLAIPYIKDIPNRNSAPSPGNGGLGLYETKTGKLHRILLKPDLSSYGSAPYFSGDSRSVAAFVTSKTKIAPASLFLWDTRTGQLQHTLRLHEAISDLRLSQDGERAAFVCDAKSVKICDTKTGYILRHLKCSEAVACLAFSPDSNTLAVGDESGTLTLYRLK